MPCRLPHYISAPLRQPCSGRSLWLFALFLSLPLSAQAATGILPRHKPVEAAAVAAPATPPRAPVMASAEKKKNTVKKDVAEKPAAAAQSSAVSAFAPRPRTAGVLPAGTPQGSAMAAGETLAVTDTIEEALPDYPAGARHALGKLQTYVIGEEDTFIDIARNYDLGYVELRAANPTVDPWSPIPGTTVVIPSFRLLPRAPQQGIVVNLGEMRLYYFETPGQPPITHPLGIGQEGLNTPTGTTTIIRKVAGPSWYPTARMRKEKPWLPAAVPPGPANPLGTHALYLGFPEIRIHGSNKPWGIGRQVSSGCMRMYPEDIISTFNIVPVGTRVTVVDQPVLVAWVDHTLYLEANPSKVQSNEIEVDGSHTTQKPLTPGLRQSIIKTAGKAAKNIDWDLVAQTMRERRGYPVAIIPATGDSKPKTKTGENTRPRFHYN